MKISLFFSQILLKKKRKNKFPAKKSKKGGLWFSLFAFVLIVAYITIGNILIAKNNKHIKTTFLKKKHTLWEILSSNYLEKENKREDLGHWLNSHFLKISSKNDITRKDIFALNRQENELNSFINSSVGSNMPNLIYGIFRNEVPVYQKSFGFNKDTKWSIASVTKTFTSVAILQLVDKGLLSLEDDIANYFPSFKIALQPKEGKAIRIKNLLNHTSGIPYRWSSSESLKSPVRKLKHYIPKQIYPAGKKFIYSNSNYAILSCLIELLSGESYPNYIRKHIFVPLAMNSSKISNYSAGASRIQSTVSDLSKFANMLMSGGKQGMGFVSGKKMLDIMITPPEHIKEIKGSINYYGFGIRAYYEKGKLHSIFHTGIYDGCLSEIRFFPKENSYLIHISNPPYYKADNVSHYRTFASALGYRYARKLNNIFPYKHTTYHKNKLNKNKEKLTTLGLNDSI